MKMNYWGLLALLLLALGCSDTRRDWTVCSAAEPDCRDGLTCNKATWRCESRDAGVDKPMNTVDAVTDGTLDASLEGGMDVSQIVDVQAKLDKPVETSIGGDGAILDTQQPDRLSPDTIIPDAGGSCLLDNDCPAGTGNAFCVNFRCVACKDHSQCNNAVGVPFCSPANTCVSCAAVDAGCGGTTPACDPTSGRCVECLQDGECKSLEKGFCRENSCVGCQKTVSSDGKNTACSGARPVCAQSGACVECVLNAECKTDNKAFCRENSCVGCHEITSGENGGPVCTGATPACNKENGRCVECVNDGDCKNGDKAFCRSNICVGCQDTKTEEDGKTACKGTTPACNLNTGRCVECVENGDCKNDTKAFCRSNSCVGCQVATGSGSSVCTGAKPACATSGACVECVQSTDCVGIEKPICDTALTTCKPCSSDSECAAKPGSHPGLCMSHQNHRCASEAETLFVDNSAGCPNASANGTATAPYCNLQNAMDATTAAKRVILVKGANVPGFSASKAIGQITLVGKEGATVRTKSLDLASPAMDLAGTTHLYVRDLSVVGATGVNNIGVRAASGTTLQLTGVKVVNNGGGGILIDGARFDLENVLVSGNDQGIDGTTRWSGIYLKSIPASGTKNLSLISAIGNKDSGFVCASIAMSLTVEGVYIAESLVTPDILNCPSSVTSCSPPAAGSCGSSLTAP